MELLNSHEKHEKEDPMFGSQRPNQRVLLLCLFVFLVAIPCSRIDAV
jgi:hypothetical protein